MQRQAVLAMSRIGVAPITHAGEKQHHKPEPQKPAPAEVPVIPEKMLHVDALDFRVEDVGQL